jgi:NAD(P)-dependent dehydrogenase (short-subunit alcohol dehydrogenase family)
MYSLQGRKAIVTGGGSGIGRSIAVRLADEGCDVAVVDINADAARETAEQVRAKGGLAMSASADVGSKESVEAALDGLMSELGAVDILVNNAGILRIGPMLEMDEKDWSDTFRVNVDGIFHVSRKVLPSMVERGSGTVVNLASWMGKKGLRNYAAYCASKFAVIALTQSLALELASKGIRVNAVCPGIIVDTAMREASDEVSKLQGLPLAADRVGTVPLGRLGLPEDVSRLVAFLVSDESDYMTGQAVNVTGGLWTN